MRLRKTAVLLAGAMLPAVILAAGTEAGPPTTAPATQPVEEALRPVPGVERPKLPEKVTRAFVIPVREEITSKTLEAMKRKIARCRTGRAELVVLDMDTWGGEVMAALDICRLIKTELENIYTVCFVRTRAVSAGAMIAMACHEIVMTPQTGSFGDCAPLLLGGKLEGVEREKVESVLRSEFEESAKRNGYNVPLSVSMVSAGVEVWLIRNKQTGQTRYVLAEEWRDQVEVAGAGESTTRPATEWVRVQVAVPEGRLLTMDPEKAQRFGFVRSIVRGDGEDPYGELARHFGLAGAPTVLEDTWSEDLVDFLTSPIVTSILVLVGILFVYIEMHTPGFGIFGAIGLLCFGILFGSRYLTGLAAWWEIGLFVLGLALLAIEIFVTPGFGVLGIAGILCCIVGLVAIVVPNPPDRLPIPTSPLDWSIFERGAFALLAGAMLGLVAAAMLARYMPRIPIANRLMLAPPTGVGGPPVAEESPMRRISEGDVGTVETLCRPVGKARFGEDLLDVATEGRIIEPGARVRVLRRDGNRLIVEPVENA